jgi:hypothetical protein
MGATSGPIAQRSSISGSTSTNGEPGLEVISFIQMIVNTFSAKQKRDFLGGRPLSSKRGCWGTTGSFAGFRADYLRRPRSPVGRSVEHRSILAALVQGGDEGKPSAAGASSLAVDFRE